MILADVADCGVLSHCSCGKFKKCLWENGSVRVTRDNTDKDYGLSLCVSITNFPLFSPMKTGGGGVLPSNTYSREHNYNHRTILTTTGS